MGACCNGKTSKHDSREEEIYTKVTRNNALSEHKQSVVPVIEMEVEKSSLNNNLTELIRKFSNNFDSIGISLKKFCLEQIWNVCRFYLDDFTNSDYVLFDLRDKKMKVENFLKKFKYINYSLDEMRRLSESNLAKFKRYLDFKNVVILLGDENISIAENFIEFLISKKINPSKVFLMDHNLSDAEMGVNNKYLYQTLEVKNFKDCPFIMLSLKFFPHLKSENFIFFDYIKSGENANKRFTKQFLSDPKNSETNIVKFFTHFKISTLFEISNQPIWQMNNDNNLNSDIPSEFKVKANSISLNCKSIYLDDLQSLSDLEDKKDKILHQFEILKYELISNKSIFIQFDENIDLDVLIYYIFLFLWKMTDIPPKKIKNYVIENFIFIKELKHFCASNFNKLEEFLKEKYEYNDENLYRADIKRGNTDIEDLKLIKEKFDYYIKRLKRGVSENDFQQIISTIEKIINNIIENPGNEKFYKIKMDSQHFKRYLALNENAIHVLELFGFTKKNIEGVDFYCLTTEANISFLKGLSFDFSNVMKNYS